jgi:Na+/melibiose symporter-like transporter
MKTRLLYASGVVNYALKDAAFGAFVLFYYKQVLGVSGTLTGLAIALSMVFDAISDPLVGVWSDRIRTRWGRRHPFMLAAVIPLALCYIALFSPPEWITADRTSTFLWLLVTVIALRTALTVFMVPYLALGAELTDDYHERTRLASARTNLGWFIGVLVPASSLLVIFSDVGGVDGRLVESHYVVYGWLNAAGVVLFSAICLRGTWRYIPHLPVQAGSDSGTGMLRELASVFSNRNFRYLVILDIAFGGVSGVIGALLMVTFTYFWVLNTVETSMLFAGAPIAAVLVIVALSPWLNRALEKQQQLRWACIVGALNVLWLVPLKLAGWLPDTGLLLFSLVFINYSIHTGSSILRTVSSHALLADIADEHELATGRRQEGSMFAAAFFAAKFITGFGYLVGGPYLDFIGLEPGAVPGETPSSVDWGLGLMMGPGIGLMMLVPVWMAFRLRLTLAGQRDTQQALARARQERG